MKKLLVSFILDETGSMGTVLDKTISGFNEYIDSLKKQENVLFTLTQFNSDKVEVVYDSVEVANVAHRNKENYIPRELTPLYDAIGQTISSLEKKAIGKTQPVLVVIQTDGQENFSKEYNSKSIFKKIDEKKKKGWTFVFLGADQDAWLTSQELGISRGNTMSYLGAETQTAFARVAKGTSCYVNTSGMQTTTFVSDTEDTGIGK